MKKIAFILCATLSLCLASCKSNIIGGSFPMDYTSYVYSYHFPTDMYLSNDYFYNHAQSWEAYLNSPYGFSVIFKDDWTQTVSQLQRGDKKDRFDALSLKHDDTSFNQEVMSGDACPNGPHNYLGFDFLSITVTSDADFDEAHPAGTPLNDIVQFIAYTPYPFIQNGYQYTAPESDALARWKEEKTLINKPLSECTPEDFILTLGLMDNWICCNQDISACYLVVKATPTLSHQHVLKVTIVDDMEQTWHASIDIHWPKQ